MAVKIGTFLQFFATPLIITAPIAIIAAPALIIPASCWYLAVEAVLVYGSGGTTIDAYIQTTLDGGLSWIDIMNFHFTTAGGTKISAVNTTTALAAAVVPTDGSIAANTILSGLIGSKVRAKYVTTGTYAGGTTLTLFGEAKG